MSDKGRPSIHLVSDSTGETLFAIGKAALARFAATDVAIHMSVFVRSAQDVETAIHRIRTWPGPVFHTLVDPEQRDRIVRAAHQSGHEAVGVLDQPIETLARFLGCAPDHRPGLQHRLTDSYFERIAALDFAISFDDGALGDRLRSADVILAGVSRTSKTPTCIYLAYRGIKAANMPLIHNREPDPAFFEAMAAGIPVVGLTASPSRLAQVRSQRLEALGDRSHDYADLDRIRAEVADARLFFQKHDIPVIDVTRRSIEETAAEIQALLISRKAEDGELPA